jgi:hypothetical protein
MIWIKGVLPETYQDQVISASLPGGNVADPGASSRMKIAAYRARAAWYRDFAETAGNEATRAARLRLAEHFERLAATEEDAGPTKPDPDRRS